MKLVAVSLLILLPVTVAGQALEPVAGEWTLDQQSSLRSLYCRALDIASDDYAKAPFILTQWEEWGNYAIAERQFCKMVVQREVSPEMAFDALLEANRQRTGFCGMEPWTWYYRRLNLDPPTELRDVDLSSGFTDIVFRQRYLQDMQDLALHRTMKAEIAASLPQNRLSRQLLKAADRKIRYSLRLSQEARTLMQFLESFHWACDGLVTIASVETLIQIENAEAQRRAPADAKTRR